MEDATTQAIVADPWAWLPAFVTAVGLVVVAAMSLWSSGRREARLLQRGQDSADRVRLLDQKHTAYAALLAELRRTPERHYRAQREAEERAREPGERLSIVVHDSELDAAAAQAKLVSTPASQLQISSALSTFKNGHSEDVLSAEASLLEIFTTELDLP